MPGTWNPAIEAAFKFVGVDQSNFNGVDQGLLQSDGRNFIPGGLNSTEKGNIINALRNLYEHSDTAAAIINAAVGFNGTTSSKNFYFMKNLGTAGSFTQTLSNGVVIDPAQKALMFMSLNGKFQSETLEDNVIHEMTHAVVGTSDFAEANRSNAYSDSNYNFPGPNQTIANRIAYEMNLKDFYQIGYNFAFGNAQK
jgi:hypothetical protein